MGQTSDRALSSRKIFDMDRCLETISDFMFSYIGAQRLNNKFQQSCSCIGSKLHGQTSKMINYGFLALAKVASHSGQVIMTYNYTVSTGRNRQLSQNQK